MVGDHLPGGSWTSRTSIGSPTPWEKKTSKILVFSLFLHIHSCQSKSALKCSIWQDECIWHLPQVCWVEHADQELHCSHLKQVWNLIFFYKFMVLPVFTFSLFDHIWAQSHTHPPTAGSPGRWWRGRQVFLRLLTEPSCKQLNFILPKHLNLSAKHLNSSCQTF